MAKETKSKKIDPRNEYLKAMQAANNKLCKDMRVSTSGYELPVGRNGAVSTGSLCVDLITGGGFAKGRMVTVSGMEASGKTTLFQRSMGMALKQGSFVHYADVEGAADGAWLRKNGVNPEKYEGGKNKIKTWYFIPDFESGEDACRYPARIMDTNIAYYAKHPNLGSMPYVDHAFYLDSIASLVPEALIENDEVGSQPLLAMLTSKYIPLIRAKLRKANCMFVATNQVRINPRAKMGANPEYETGGSAPRFYADVKIRMQPQNAKSVLDRDKADPFIPKDNEGKLFKMGGVVIEPNENGEERHVYSKVYTSKNRVFPPLKETFIRICREVNGGPGRGFDIVYDTIRFYQEIGLMTAESLEEVHFEGKRYSYWDLKNEILTKPDLIDRGNEMLESGEAFTKYFERIGAEFGSPDTETTDAELEELMKADEEEAGREAEKESKKGKKTAEPVTEVAAEV